MTAKDVLDTIVTYIDSGLGLFALVVICLVVVATSAYFYGYSAALSYEAEGIVAFIESMCPGIEVSAGTGVFASSTPMTTISEIKVPAFGDVGHWAEAVNKTALGIDDQE